jgi:hypothetical protein
MEEPPSASYVKDVEDCIPMWRGMIRKLQSGQVATNLSDAELDNFINGKPPSLIKRIIVD